MITQRQVEVLKAIAKYIKNKGYSPTIREIGDMVEFESSSSVHGYLDSLEKLGCINRVASSPRAIAVTEEGMRLLKLLT